MNSTSLAQVMQLISEALQCVLSYVTGTMVPYVLIPVDSAYMRYIIVCDAGIS